MSVQKQQVSISRVSPNRSICTFTKLSNDGEPTTPIAVDMKSVACVTLSKLTGDVILVTKGTPRKGTIVIAESFTDVIKSWKAFGEVLVFHTESRDAERSIPCAVSAAEILSIDVGRGSRKVILNTVNDAYILKDSFEDAVRIWQTDAT